MLPSRIAEDANDTARYCVFEFFTTSEENRMQPTIVYQYAEALRGTKHDISTWCGQKHQHHNISGLH